MMEVALEFNCRMPYLMDKTIVGRELKFEEGYLLL
jgi:hypothetical protein